MGKHDNVSKVFVLIRTGGTTFMPESGLEGLVIRHPLFVFPGNLNNCPEICLKQVSKKKRIIHA